MEQSEFRLHIKSRISIQYKGDIMRRKKGYEIIVLTLSVCATAFIYFKFAIKDIEQESILGQEKLSQNESDVLNQISNDADQVNIKISDNQESESILNSKEQGSEIEKDKDIMTAKIEKPSELELKKAKYYLDRNWAGDDNCSQSAINYLILNPNALNANNKVVDNNNKKSDTKVSSLK